MRHLLTLYDLSLEEINTIFALAQQLQRAREDGDYAPRFPGRILGLLFSKPSLRTRVSFEALMAHLGGSSIYLGKDVGWGERESASDFNRVLTQYLDVIVCRTGDHSVVERMRDDAACPVINGLTSQAHPCQALTDLYTLRQHRPELAGAKIAYVGDGNNVARSLAIGSAHCGVAFTQAAPSSYHFDASFLQQLKRHFPTAQIELTDDPDQAVEGADVVYTDVWSSMGQEAEEERRRRDFARFQVNGELMNKAPTSAIFMHCLPARRGEEVTDEVMDSQQSVVVQQAANRMHVQKGIVAWLLEQA